MRIESLISFLSSFAHSIYLFLFQAVNKKLAKGFPLIMPQFGLPVQFHNMHLQVVEHALLISTDATLSPLENYAQHQRFTGCSYYN